MPKIRTRPQGQAQGIYFQGPGQGLTSLIGDGFGHRWGRNGESCPL